MRKKHTRCLPQNDLDCYYNIQWKKLHDLSSIKLSLDNFTLVQDKIDEYLSNFIIDATPGTNSILDQLVCFRDSYYNINQSTRLIEKLIDSINQISNQNDLARIIKQLSNLDIHTFFNFGVIPHHKCPNVYALSINEPNLTLETSDAYHKDSQSINDLLKMLKELYKFANENWNYHHSNIDDFISGVLTMEALLSKLILTTEQTLDVFLTHQSDCYDHFLKKFEVENFWEIIIGEYNCSNFYIVYDNHNLLLLIKNLLQEWNEDDIVIIKSYLVYCVLKKYGFYRCQKIFDMIIPYSPNKRKIFLNIFYETFGYYLQSVFNDRFIDSSKFDEVDKIFQTIKKYCLKTISKSKFFGHKTKREAIAKMETLDLVLGKQKYNVNLRELPTLTNDFYDNLAIINSFYHQKTVAFIGQDINRYYLSFSNDILSFHVNAYYDPPSNVIYIPTSIINDLFIDVEKDPIYNYGSMGSIIGHEMMHCFDDYGALFDHCGRLRNWWLPEDYAKYNKEIQKVKNHYDLITINDQHIDTSASMSENIADINGLKVSLRSYIENYMPNLNINSLIREKKERLKIFFMRWAQTMRTVYSQEKVSNDLQRHLSHLPNTIRINAPFSHMDEYYLVYDVMPYHENYLAPEKRSKFMDN